MQAFCRVAAVHGAIYMLRQELQGLALKQEGGTFLGVVTAEGCLIKGAKLAANADILVPLVHHCKGATLQRRGLSRGLAILDGPLKEGESQVLVTIPPGTVGNQHAVRALQLGAATNAAPQGR